MITLPSGRKIGEGEPTFIIAEIGSNWRTLDDCKHSIVQAKACGADAVKFQLYTHEALYGLHIHYEHGHPIGYENVNVNPAVEASSLPCAWLPVLAEKARSVGIEFMCSAFSPDLLDAVDPYVSIHKVASAECTHKRMLERLAKLQKPVILSTGAHGPEDVAGAIQVLTGAPTVLLYCVAAYPARRVDLSQMELLASSFGLPVGFSDHTTSADVIPLVAQNMGACVIEKHVTFTEVDSPDAPHSLTGDEFRAMVETLRGDWSKPDSSERPMILRHNRRLIATRDIAEGESLAEGQNFGIYRSLKDEHHAFHPFMVDEVNGGVARHPIKAGDGIGPGDV